jgi:hypothetical protein
LILLLLAYFLLYEKCAVKAYFGGPHVVSTSFFFGLIMFSSLRLMATTLLMAASAAALAAPATTYEFTYAYVGQPYVITGSAMGTLYGNLVKDLSSIHVQVNGTPLAESAGGLLGSGLSGSWVIGGAVMSLDGLENNFLFSSDVTGEYFLDTSSNRLYWKPILPYLKY